ncbi:hypothetical protein CFA71_24095 [Mycobacteroides abscessus subsp. bolletii]|nr:hypothetical protein CFA71_24095 [Mycobacteroides abscessus subsp. bolletii]
MRVHLGDWWTPDDDGRVIAHRVGAVFPDLRSVEPSDDRRPKPSVMLAYDHSYWVPLCTSQTAGSATGSVGIPALFSTYMPWEDHERCSACKVLGPAFDKWLNDGESRRKR